MSTMADEEQDSDSEVEEYSGMEQPPLIKQLKTILAEYPDDGQIIKELVQNAEDAGASEMKIMYDGRRLNTDTTKKAPYRKFFKAPALCFYNNEVFNEADWKGIRMIYSSVKEEDPLKVGRFGLGFKSVFHITDNPCIISGSKILLMNPHEKNPGKVCITMELNKLKKCKRLKVEEFLDAFTNTFGFSADNLNSGHYMGTIFWFPLRESTTETSKEESINDKNKVLSDTSYDRSKVLDLFKSYQLEATHSLLFLKSLSKVNLYCRHSETEYDFEDGRPFFSIEMEDDEYTIQEKRKQFLKDVIKTCGTIPEYDIVSVTSPTFKTRYRTRDHSGVDEMKSSWLVVNVYKGGKMSEKLKQLVNDKDLSYMPYVGAAVPLTDNEEPVKGHIFCFLPLPQEKKSLTGLPVHFNGFFALSQNRRHLKWASADQDTLQMHRDKAIEWNECLVTEVLPEIYLRLIKEMIKISDGDRNTEQAVKAVYRCIPDDSMVESKWEGCAEVLYDLLLATDCVFVPKRSKWVKPLEPLYTMFDAPNISCDQREIVIKLLNLHKHVDNTSVPVHIWELLKKISSRKKVDAPKDVSPSELCKIIKTGDTYRHTIGDIEKLIILEYLTKDSNFEMLQGLELIPLEDGSFATFQQFGTRPTSVYLCTKNEIALFPGKESRFILTSTSEHLKDVMRQIMNSGKYQIKSLEVTDVVNLLDTVIRQSFGDTEPVKLKSLTNRRLENWLENLWLYLFKHFSNALPCFQSLPLIPCLIHGSWDDGTWKNGEVHLYNMNHTFLVKSSREVEELSSDICKALEHLTVKILPSLPEWFDARKLHCVFSSNGLSLVRMFEQLSSKSPQCIDYFNSSCKASNSEALVFLLDKIRNSLTYSAISFLQQLKLFSEKVSTGDTNTKLCTVSENQGIVSHSVSIPVRFTKPYLVSNSVICMSVAKQLGACEVSEEQIVNDVLNAMNSSSYNSNEVQKFMLWFLTYISKYQSKSNILFLASSIAFVPNGLDKAKPCELYDPRDKSLQTLFADENRFPVGDFRADSVLTALKNIGLRSRNDITTDYLYATARKLDQMCTDNCERASAGQKAKAFLHILEEKSDILREHVSTTGRQLHESILELKCLPHKKEKPNVYPENLLWKGTEVIFCSPSELKNITFSNVVGSVVPLIKFNSANLGQYFNWNLQPEATVLVQQLQNLMSAYIGINKSLLLPFVSDVYKAMAGRTAEIISCHEFQRLLQDNCIWWGDGFCTPSHIVLDKSREDIELSPYMYTLPTELESLKTFFRAINCHQSQDITVLLKVLGLVGRKYAAQPTTDENEVQKDLHLVLQILNKLYRYGVSPEHVGDKLLFPVHTDGGRTLDLKPYSQCTYCDAEWLKKITEEDGDDEDLHYVHADVSSEIAEGLGVKSLKRQLMSDAEGLEEWGQEEPLTRRLHNILKDGYVDGLAVPKEIIQNADDAGATTVQFVYDERENADARTKLLDEGMASCQGPALWAYNDSLFTDSDLRNITKLSGATKGCDSTKIGKFGLGFCAVYNLTDVPSFVSGRNMVIFDPHTKFLNKALPGKSPGLKINLKTMKNKRLMKKMHNQFKPFHNILGCDLMQSDPFFNGTLFRLPLRTAQQAAVSEIKCTSYTRDEMKLLLKQFVEACGNLLLFTQNVKELKLYHIPPSGVLPDSAELICKVSKEFLIQSLNKTILDTCSEMKAKKSLPSSPFSTIQKVKINIQCEEHLQIIANIGACSFETHWLISWATGTSKSLQLSYSTNITGALPLGSVACLVKDNNGCLLPESLQNVTFGFYKTGHVFCYLPLPMQTNLDFHLNGNFAVTSNRRGLQTNTEDDKYSYDSQWNDALLSDALSIAFIKLLVQLHEFEILSRDYKFYQIWPIDSDPVIRSFQRSVYQNILLSDSIVFESFGKWLDVSHCMFLSKTMSRNTDIAEIAISALQQFLPNPQFGVVSLPSKYLNELEINKEWEEKANIVDEQKFFINYLLPHIADRYWLKGEKYLIHRKKLLIYCLEHTTPNVDSVLRTTECVPTNIDGILRRPCELVHPDGRVAKLFEQTDGRFPEKEFTTDVILRKLLDLGMMKNTLPPELIIDRVGTVPTLVSNGLANQAIERVENIMSYLATCRDLNQNILQKLGDIEFLPVFNRPANWPFTWRADRHFCQQPSDKRVFFEKAKSLFFHDCKDLVACTELVLDHPRLLHLSFNKQLLVQIGVKTKSDINLDMVVEQLLAVCDSKDILKDDLQKLVEDDVLEQVYKYLNESAALDGENFLTALPRLKDKPVILLESELLPASKVAFHVGYYCVPELYEIGKNKIGKHKAFLQTIGVKERFEVRNVVEVLQRKKIEFDHTKLCSSELQLIHQLLELLSDLMTRNELKFQDIKYLGEENIVAPDTEMILWPTHMLCLDDLEFTEASISMRFVHSSISRSVAENLGIATKKRRYIQDCSIGLPYEQKEELVTRLKGLLDGYPFDIGIMKELIQNADDANASEIHFIKDYQTHSCKKIFDQSFDEFQGPALLVFNDSAFSQADLKGLKELGVGTKRADPAKTGHYGVGFNAVYNLTDLPSFLTKGPEIEGGETLCLFDPLQKFCKETCGLRCNLKHVRNAFPDVLLGYNEKHIFGDRRKGTIFRFPLRQTTSDLGKTVTVEQLDDVFINLKAELSSMLLFLRSVTKISVSDISSGILTTDYSVFVELDENDLEKRRSFSKCCKERAKEVKSNKSFTALSPPIQVQYQLQLKDNIGKKENWIVVQRLGIVENNVSEEVKTAIEKGKLGMLPLGGVAVNVLERKNKGSVFAAFKRYFLGAAPAPKINQAGKIHCFLPLPVKSGLPININGHFALDHEARRSLWVEEKGYRSAWNCLLLSDTIVHSYIEALKCLRSIIFDRSLSNGYTREHFDEDVTMFDNYFPVVKQVNGKYEQFYVKSVFETIISSKEELFPISIQVLSSANDHNPSNYYQVRWSAYKPQGHQFPVVCTHDNKSVFHLYMGDLLKALGLKLTLITPEILDSMLECNCPVSDCDPKTVIQFLKSYNSAHIDRIQLEPLPCKVAATKFQSTENVHRLIKFCSKAKEFKDQIDGLPVLVTNDGVLRLFDKNQKIYSTEFCDLFPQSASVFVHKDLVNDLRKINIDEEHGVQSVISMDTLKGFLESETDRSLHRGSNMVEFRPLSKVLRYEWIRELWDLIVHFFQTVYEETSAQDAQRFYAYMRPIHDWCLIPAVQGDRENVLIRINRTDTVLSMESFRVLQSLETILSKLKLPKLNTHYLSTEAISKLSLCMASSSNPVALLVCLHYHRNAFETINLERVDSFAILNFFSENLKDMTNYHKAEEWWIRDSLRSLPIFLTQEGTFVSLEHQDMKVHVLPKGMPSEGIREWALETNRLLLQENICLKKIYSFLQFSFTSISEIYLEHLLPTLQYLPLHSVKRHLEFIRDALLKTGVSKGYDSQQVKLIQILKNTAVIPKNGERFKASKFFSPHNNLFKLFCNSEDFPPVEYSNCEWKEFFELIGMKTEVTDNMFIEYAREVFHEGSHRITEKIEKKSNALVNFILQNHLQWGPDIYAEISCIRFVIPYCAQNKYTEVHEQYTVDQKLICFCGSISYRFEDLSWTSLPLLPKMADPYSYVFYISRENSNDPANQKTHLLGIHDKPTLDSVILHCQNVCDSLKERLSDKNLKDRICGWLPSFMEKLYSYLEKNAVTAEKCRKRLEHTPVVYLPELQTVVPANQTVITILPEQEITPFLVKVPTRYIRFCSLFTFLGAAENPNYILYVNVLARLKANIGDRVLDAEYMADWLAITGAVNNLFQNLNVSTLQRPPVGTVLYLPTRDKKLLASHLVTVSNNMHQERRLLDVDLNYFIGFKELGLQHKLDVIKCLPEEIRPRYLTQVIREEVDMSEVCEVLNSQEAKQLERFLQSTSFIEGVLRLLKHAKFKRLEAFSWDEETQITSDLQNVQVHCVTGLRTHLFIQDRRIETSVEPKTCYFHHQEDNWKIYFQDATDNRQEWFRKLDQDVVRFIMCITRKGLRENGIEIYKLIHMINNESEISLLLDRMNIDAYDLPQDLFFSVFPPPGTYVPIELHHLLNCGISQFGIHEYRCCAYEVEDELLFDDVDISESYNPVYIYVRIKQKICSDVNSSTLNQLYEIDTGNENITVPVFKLYKFIRPYSGVSVTELVDTDCAKPSVSTQTISKEKYSIRFQLLEAWKLQELSDRKRVIGRLLRRWHPDKNIGNETFCNEMFIYLKEFITKLENGITLDGSDEIDGRPQQNRAYPDFTSSQFYRFCERMSQRSHSHRTHAQEYYTGNSSSYSRSSGVNTHCTSGQKVYHDYGEARRWYNQAKVDLRNAVDTIDTPGNPRAFNWICYMCHQAAEKALKAACFAKNANNVPRQSHDIHSIAMTLGGTELSHSAANLTDVTGEHTRMRYPDMLHRPQIPSTVFNREHAERACELAQQILSLVQEEYLA